MNQTCLLSRFSQASYREGPEFAGKVPKEHEAHDTLGTKELPFPVWEALCFDSVVQDTKVSKGARWLTIT